ncbi:MAG: box helicase protein [Actinomycetota bacterium]|nr:box helicase protein [Actinomycetota bacterium]
MPYPFPETPDVDLVDVDLAAVVEALADDGQVVHVERIPPRAARHQGLARPLPDAVAALVPGGRLWSHQAAAVDLARSGTSVAVSTGTASGKSLCYQLPVAEAALDGGTALLLFPTKALAQDQSRSLQALGASGVVAVTYDGDTPTSTRTWARRSATAVLTNPDMLHVGILPHHERWARFLGRLRYVAVDELHMLRGIFGSHVAHVLRRLRRVCAYYGSDPTFVFCSATIGRPGDLASALCGLPVAEVTDDGSPRGERVFVLWNPPITDEEAGKRASGHHETARLLGGLVTAGSRAIAFTRSRLGAELVAAEARRRVPAELAGLVRPYRGGYLASERREIEAELFGGQLRGVAATNALELGIDVGGLDACILDGFPGTIASMWQQAGRAGRQCQQSAAVLVAGEDQLDQWWMAHPSELFTRSPEPAVVNPSNPFVLGPHLACAAYELPLTPADDAWWGDDLEDGVRRLVLTDQARLRDGLAVYAGRGAPAPRVGLRTGSSASEYRIVDGDGRLVGTVDEARAFSSVHPGALYLHQGRQFRVERLDLDDRAAWVAPAAVDETTRPRTETDVAILGVDERAVVGRAELFLGPVEVTQRVVAYQRRKRSTGEVVETVPLQLPPTTLTTRGFWYVLDDDLLVEAGIHAARVLGTVHAVEHAAIGILPVFTICDRWDVGGLSTNWQVETGRATIVIYDGYPGGAGIAELGFAAGRRHLEITLDVVARCGCVGGCPSCVQSPKCGNWNEPLDKAGAVSLLRMLLGDGG